MFDIFDLLRNFFIYVYEIPVTHTGVSQHLSVDRKCFHLFNLSCREGNANKSAGHYSVFCWLRNERNLRLDDEPDAADALAGHVARFHIFGEEVERVTVVGDLQFSV